jgi:hypothetical protein
MNGLNVKERQVVNPLFPDPKTYLGFTEIRQLIENDMMRTASIEVAEQHHLAWCLARYLALRPGSIGAESYSGPNNKRHDAHLTWRDLDIQRDGTEKGRFKVIITIRFWKQSRDPDAARVEPKTYTIVSPPNPDQIIFSVPHRLLVIALRRGLLVDYTNINDLFAGDKLNILVRDDQLDEPVLYAAAHRGLGLDTTKPLNAHGLTDYIRERGKVLGYAHPISFYSIRRRAATDLTVNYGADVAREIMGHSADSRTLETAYLNMRLSFNPTAAGFGLPLDPMGQDTSISGPSDLSSTALDAHRVLRTQGEALNVVTQQLMAVDPDNSAVGTEEYKNYRRRIKAQAYRILVTAQMEAQRREETQGTSDNRALLAQASMFQQEIERFAKDPALASALMAVPGEELLDQDEQSATDAQHEDDSSEPFVTQEYDEEPALEEPSGDLSGLVSETAHEPLAGPSAPHAESSAEAPPIPYETFAKLSMTLITNNALSTHEFWETRNKTCPACNEDPTMDQEAKDKQYRSPAVLASHMSSNVHSGLERVKRQLDINARDLQPRRYYCLYSCGKNWARRRDCVDHMEQSSQETDGVEHDAAKAADGWYDAGFKGSGSIQYHQELERNRKRLYMHAGLEFEEIPQLQESTAHPTDPHILLGAFPPHTIPTHLRNEVVELDGFVDSRPEWRAALQTHIDSGEIIEYDNISAVPQQPIPPRLQFSVRELDEVPTLVAKKKAKTSDRRVSWAPLE